MNNIKKPLYLTIYQDILNEITSRTLNPGDKVLSEKELSEKYKVSRITSKKALEMLSEEGYISRSPGRGSFINPDVDISVAENKSHKPPLIGLIIEDFAENFGTFIISGVERACAKMGYTVVLKRSFGSQKKEKQAIDEMLALGVEGLIILPVHGDNYSESVLKLAIDKFPTVLIDRELKGIPLSYVGTDNFNSAKELTDYLFEKGHKEMCFLGPLSPDTSTVNERVDGFIKSNAEHNIITNDANFINLLGTLPNENADGNTVNDADIIRKYLESAPNVTAIFAVEYNLALTALQVAEELGKNIPDDFEIVCFDGPENYIGRYEFTHIRQNEEQIGKESLMHLLDIIKNSVKAKNIIVNAKLCKSYNCK